ncbi:MULTISPECIES: DNA primase [unclassified Campylobacter]|uniref:DNA primase n=1 Tax=unclassified Campylobacter TaxID=2593542 RepID=UPI0022E9BEB4|nr:MULTISPECIES: DNA primase [unclassified Campylobacter]MDA3054411.1 DNA primase [Campylobacter sp. VBCF_07 NA4]MDA3060803.1 DNA primase [Campylobacter sp. VBCF_02 NA5]MDA3069930.1 DNA primase [Campylobacter sp. VBCF_08 NA3]WBR54370.1 DNA primase [Campylobacter sp. VBCF_01 NA2]
MIKNESIERLLAVADIVDVVERYVPLKRSGSNFVGICPFHDDSHPSMSVSSRLGIFHCFSCKAGGNAIKFVQDYEKLNFKEAVEKLASMYGFELEYTNERNFQREDKKILEILNAFYQSQLYNNPSAVEYLHSRGLSDETIQKFGLGWAGPSAQTIRVLQNEQIEARDAFNVGAIKQNERGSYASFIERITFPIHNHTGKIVGFGGRTISGNPAKYVNSPQCAVFDKSRIFYAYNLAKKSAYDKKTLIITEGYMDVIMLHQAGIDNAVAVLGTALTPLHLPLIKRGDLRVILSFDGDSAGINAAIKSARLLCANGIDNSVVIIGGGADPADMVQAGKVRELAQIYANGMEGGEFLIRQIAKKYDLTRPVQKEQALNEIKEFTNALNPVVAQSYTSLVAQILDVSPSAFSLSSNSGASANFAPKQNLKPQENAPKPESSNLKDITELQVIKSMLLNENFMANGLNCLSVQDFRMHGRVYEALISAQKSEDDEQSLRALALDNKILAITNETNFIKACMLLRRRVLEEQMQKLLVSNDPDRLDKILEYQKKINELKGKK